MFDHAIRGSIVEALAADPLVDDDGIAVECFEGGDVVLRGRVAGPTTRRQAVRTTRHVAGVRTVDDRLRPRRPGASDGEAASTEVAVLDALISDGALSAEANRRPRPGQRRHAERKHPLRSRP